MTYQIKKLDSGDLSLAQNVFILFKKVFDETDITAKNLPEEKYLEHLLATPTFHIFGAIADGKIVGGLTAYEFEMYLKKEKEAYLYDLAVDKDYRRQGIARALIDAMKQYGRENDISTLFVEAHEEDTGAVEFYTALDAQMEKVMHFNITP